MSDPDLLVLAFSGAVLGAMITMLVDTWLMRRRNRNK